MFVAINEARESLLLTTSYFVPPESLTTALESAARRGVHVRLLVSGKSANPSTVYAGRSYYDSLLDAGVEIYEYEHELLHSKTLTIGIGGSFTASPLPSSWKGDPHPSDYQTRSAHKKKPPIEIRGLKT